jgi:outer membrane protein
VRPVRQWIAAGLCGMLAGPFGWSQQAIDPIKPSGIFRTYAAPEIPASRLTNGARLRSLIQGGKLYLTAQDAVAIALENNIDIETDRYNAPIDVWNYTRQEAGGPLPGVPSGSSQAGSVQSGEGVAGSQAAAGVSNSGSNNNGGNGTNTTVSQIGPVTPTLDPAFQSSAIFSHKSAPQPNLTQAQVVNLIDNTRNYQESVSAGLITGGKASLTYADSYLNENSPSDLLNPQNGTSLTLSFQHNLLYGFGRALNARNITIAKANIGINDLTFKTQVIAVVAGVLNNYYSLAADYEDLKAKKQALDVAERFFEDNKKQVQIGTMAPLDVTTAEAQVATSQEALVVSETTLQQDQVTLKNLLSRNGLSDPVIANVDIVPLDHIEVPAEDHLPPFKEALATAMTNRADLQVDKLNLINSETSALGTSNGVLPSLVGFGTLKTQGLSGTPQTVVAGTIAPNAPSVIPPGYVACPVAFGKNTICQVPDKYFQGGVGNALGQMIRRDFPSQSGGIFFGPTLRNRQAGADQSIDQLSLRQTEVENHRTINQVAVDVSNQLIGLQQARIRYQAAVKNRVLEEQLLDAEQKKFALGASTTFNVVTQQRDLATAQATEIASLSGYSQARVLLDQTLGVTLKTNNVQIEEAQKGQVARQSTLPANLP